ncbi:MAG: glycosyltransferase family 2 protein [Duncaniella sp.]|nr:glycosyltransferase family 2 protein [Duncaniella sp.]
MTRATDITVVIPVYNRAHTLPRTLRSIDRQTISPARIILVDNGSIDSSLSIAREWAATRPDVTVLSEPRRGACAARNRGLAEVNTAWTMFFDSDDEMLPRHIADFHEATRHYPTSDIIGRDALHVDVSGHTRRLYFCPSQGNPLFHHLFRGSLATQRYMARTELFRRAGGWNESLKGWDDFELGTRMLLQSPRVLRLMGEPTVTIHWQAESLTGIDFSSRPEVWEAALETIRHDIIATPTLNDTTRQRYLRWADGVAAILAARYAREGNNEAQPAEYRSNAYMRSRDLLERTLHATDRPAIIRLIFHHNRLFGRLTWPLAKLLL